ncbi:hypothetical protein [Candidatus Palauibacter sp.]|uniref:hypothetical protein n=1 Tax=Candidatus Palauibacter sp. TaxID=3101350 RepID=UPI003B52A0EC
MVSPAHHVLDDGAPVFPYDELRWGAELAWTPAGATEVAHVSTGGVHHDHVRGARHPRPVQQVEVARAVEGYALNGGEQLPLGGRCG